MARHKRTRSLSGTKKQHVAKIPDLVKKMGDYASKGRKEAEALECGAATQYKSLVDLTMGRINAHKEESGSDDHPWWDVQDELDLFEEAFDEKCVVNTRGKKRV